MEIPKIIYRRSRYSDYTELSRYFAEDSLKTLNMICLQLLRLRKPSNWQLYADLYIDYGQAFPCLEKII